MVRRVRFSGPSATLVAAVAICSLLPTRASSLYLNGSASTTWPANAIPVCFRANGTQGNGYTVDYSTAAVRTMVQETIEGTWELWTEIDFTGWDVCDGSLAGRIYVDLVERDNGGAGGSPYGYSASGNLIRLDFHDNTSLDRRRNVAIHEFGHSLGFRHEHDRPEAFFNDDPNEPKCSDSPNYWSSGTDVTEYYDDVSIMNYCSQWRPSLSLGDIVGVQQLYGSSPAGVWLNAVPIISLPTI